MKDNCPICCGVGWVCERHPDKPYDGEIGCACGAPCECNDSDPPDTRHVTVVVEALLHEGPEHRYITSQQSVRQWGLQTRSAKAPPKLDA